MGLELLLIIVIAIAGMIVQSRLQKVFGKYSRVMFHGGLTGREVAEKMLRDHGIGNQCKRPSHRPLQPGQQDPEPLRLGIQQQQRCGRGSGSARMRACRAARRGLCLPEDALRPRAHSAVLVDVRPDSDHFRTRHDERIPLPVLDRHRHVLHDIPLQRHHPAGSWTRPARPSAGPPAPTSSQPSVPWPPSSTTSGSEVTMNSRRVTCQTALSC